MKPVAESSVIFLCLLSTAFGCSGPNHRPDTYPVSGQVYFRGQRAAGAVIQLTALNGRPFKVLAPHAIVAGDGTFEITTYVTGDGAPAGTYALTLTWSVPPKPGFEDDGPDRFRKRYADVRQPLRKVEVKTAENNLGRIDLN